jgi:hypothetical protein
MRQYAQKQNTVTSVNLHAYAICGPTGGAFVLFLSRRSSSVKSFANVASEHLQTQTTSANIEYFCLSLIALYLCIGLF